MAKAKQWKDRRVWRMRGEARGLNGSLQVIPDEDQ
jgi:hypothetical protein